MQDQLCMSGTVMYSIEKCDLICKKGGVSKDVEFQVVDKELRPRLVTETCQNLNLIKIFVNDKVNALLGDQTTKPFLTKEVIVKEYKDVFEGVGCMGGNYYTDIKPDIKPVVHPPRKVPQREPHTKKLEKLVNKKILAIVSEPTNWMSSTAIVDKPNRLRTCIDLQYLKKAATRLHYPLSSIGEAVTSYTDVKVFFSVLDAKNGLWQVKPEKSHPTLLHSTHHIEDSGGYECHLVLHRHLKNIKGIFMEAIKVQMVSKM